MADLPESNSPTNEPDEKRRNVGISDEVEQRDYVPSEYSPSLGPGPPPDPDSLGEGKGEDQTIDAGTETETPTLGETAVPESVADPPDVEMSDGVNVPIPDGDDELLVNSNNRSSSANVLEVSLDVVPEDITDNPLCLWGVLEECLVVTPKSKLRRVEVNFRKLSPQDKKLFVGAMKKEWNSWIENKVTSLCKGKGIPADRIIKARWVLVWKKSSDPDDRTRTPKARLALVGWQDPELGQIQTDSPTLRKETKHLILTICASKR